MLYVWRGKVGLDACCDMQITGRIIAQIILMGKGEERHGNLVAPKQLLDRRTIRVAILHRPPAMTG
jgi:hypothetical protein